MTFQLLLIKKIIPMVLIIKQTMAAQQMIVMIFLATSGLICVVIIGSMRCWNTVLTIRMRGAKDASGGAVAVQSDNKLYRLCNWYAILALR